MTDLPRLSATEFQDVLDVLKAAADPLPKRSHKAKIREPCGCNCEGCTDPGTNSAHCLEPPCTRQRNRRSNAEIKADERYPNGRARLPGSKPRPRKPKLRTPQQLKDAERYPSGRVKPDRSNWASSSTPKTHPETPPTTPPNNPLPTWFVHAHRGGTVVRLPAHSMGEAIVVAGRLAGHGWDGGEHGDQPVIEGGP